MIPAVRFEPKNMAGENLAYYYNEAVQKRAPLIFVDHDIFYPPFVHERMSAYIEAEPDIPHVSPYLLYPKSTGLPRPVWHMRNFLDQIKNAVWSDITWQFCDSFAFGFAYVPKKDWDALYSYVEFLNWRHVADEYCFFRWYNRYPQARIHWDCLVCHSHS